MLSVCLSQLLVSITSTSQMNAANRVAVNTGVLYARMLITMGITLYSTRLILNALGTTDYGIFNLLAGIILMLSFLNNAMATATQRFLSFHQGRADLDMQRLVFNNSILLHVAIGVIVVIGLKIASPFLFDGFLNIPEDRMPAAKQIFDYMVVAVFFTILSVPYTASLVAHEDLIWVAFVGIMEVLMKLGMALYLTYAITGDKLIEYGFMQAAAAVIAFFLYALYCYRKYSECDLKGFGNISRGTIKELGSFAGWNLLGILCNVLRNQGFAVLLNMFFGAILNAAYGIANQVSAQLNFFSITLLRATNPQIMKSEGAGDRERMLRLSMITSKFAFFLFAAFSIPVIFEMDDLLHLWLVDVPEYTVIFCQLVLLTMLTNQLTIGLQSAAQAAGRIKTYQITISAVLVVSLPIAYLLLKMGYPPYVVLASNILIEFTACMFRMFFVKHLAGLRVKTFVQRVFLKEIFPLLFQIVTCWAIIRYLEFPFRYLFTGAVSLIVFSAAIYFLGLCKDERDMVDGIISKGKSVLLRRRHKKKMN